MERETKQTKGIDHAFVLFYHAIQAADPFSSVAQCTYALYAMGALEGWDEEVPCDGGVTISVGNTGSVGCNEDPQMVYNSPCVGYLMGIEQTDVKRCGEG